MDKLFQTKKFSSSESFKLKTSIFTADNIDYLQKVTLFNNKELIGESHHHWHVLKSEEISKTKYVVSKLNNSDYNLVEINDTITLRLPKIINELSEVFIEAKYILELVENWDDEGSVAYNESSWTAGAHFLIKFMRSVRNSFAGSLHLPKMYHGPKGTIDLVWNEANFRLFINIDYYNNKGTFYSDTPNKQFSEGEFNLDDFKFQLIPLPFKY